ncbi:RING-H2 finger protein ATL1 [Raphanus sativus]|nr:RING-H2 finger protein ATL1 [Raphanus sativus]
MRSRDFLADQATSDEALISRKFDLHAMHKRERMFHKVTSMGDECINTRGKDSQFSEIQPIRRSISMDSSLDRKLYLAVQEVIGRNKGKAAMVAGDGGGCAEDCSSSGGDNNRVMKRCFFSFGSSRCSRSSSILPV